VEVRLVPGGSSLPPATGLYTVTYEDFQSAKFLDEAWNDLLYKSTFPNIFLTWEWITTWWEWFGSEGNLQIITAFEGEEVVGILPTYLSQISIFPGIKIPAVRFIGDGGPVFPDYLGPIVKEGEEDRVIDWLAKFLFSISEQWQMILLSDVLTTSKVISTFVDILSQRFPIDTREGVRCPYQLLPDSYETFLAELNPRRRESVRRNVRKARKKYSLRFECHTSPDSVDRVFQIVLEIYKKSLRGKTNDQGFNRSDYLGFHRDVARKCAERGWLKLYILWFNDIPVAFIYGYFYAGVFWYYQTGFDQAHTDDGPGSIILQLVIESVINEGGKEFDFLRGEEDYKYHFTKNERRTRTVKAFRKSGMLHMAMRTQHNLSDLIHKFDK